MKKISLLTIIGLIIASCSTGVYLPYAQNDFGAQTTVVLNKKNFRVVKNVEAVISVNNTRLTRADAASSAYGELLRQANLTGSQVLTNVVIEEIRRETAGFFRLLFNCPKKVQFVAARATVIEFLDKNGQPIKSEAYTSSVAPSAYKETVSDNPTTRKNQSVQEEASAQDLKKINDTHREIDRLATQLYWENKHSGVVFNYYKRLCNALPMTKENAQTIMNIQSVVLKYYSGRARVYPNLEEQLKKATSQQEEIDAFLLYYQK